VTVITLFLIISSCCDDARHIQTGSWAMVSYPGLFCCFYLCYFSSLCCKLIHLCSLHSSRTCLGFFLPTTKFKRRRETVPCINHNFLLLAPRVLLPNYCWAKVHVKPAKLVSWLMFLGMGNVLFEVEL
jgi:hypothetical protein